MICYLPDNHPVNCRIEIVLLTVISKSALLKLLHSLTNLGRVPAGPGNFLLVRPSVGAVVDLCVVDNLAGFGVVNTSCPIDWIVDAEPADILQTFGLFIGVLQSGKVRPVTVIVESLCWTGCCLGVGSIRD